MAAAERDLPAGPVHLLGLLGRSRGYNENAPALEQIGTEVECSPSGQVRSSAWYEIVPAPSPTIRLRVRPGDWIAATVAVRGRGVVMTLVNATTRQSFRKVLSARVTDLSSAEWIVEAPARSCPGESSCPILPLANFGSTAFTNAYASTVGGHVGPISDRTWRSTAITLLPASRPFVSIDGSIPPGTATPTALRPGGSAFEVTYTALTMRPQVALRRPRVAAYPVHPAR